MSMMEWAKREVEIACKREKPDRKEGEWDYGCACYESALKAFESLCEDGHSGFSIQMTKQILMRMIDGKPLTPIEDTEDIWRDCTRNENDYKSYQCKRESSLFKDVYNDGTVKYSDVDRIICCDVNDPRNTWSNGFVRNIVDEMFPITMPYIPENKPYKVYCEEFLTDPKNGDFDTLEVMYVVAPNGDQVVINRYFKDGEKSFDEITFEEYMERSKKAAERLEGAKEANREVEND